VPEEVAPDRVRSQLPVGGDAGELVRILQTLRVRHHISLLGEVLVPDVHPLLSRFAFRVEGLELNMKRFRGGLVFKAHRLWHHSTLGWRVIKKKKVYLVAEHRARARVLVAVVGRRVTRGRELGR